MISVSQDFLDALAVRNDFTRRGIIHLISGETLSIGSGVSDITDFSFKGSNYSDSAGATTLPLGMAIGRLIEIELMNNEGQLQPDSGAYDFFNAQVELYLDFEVDGDVEEVVIGVFTVTSPATWGSTVKIYAVDDMIRTDKPYQTVIPFPATLRQIYEDACTNCGLLYTGTSFRNQTFEVKAPFTSDYTYRQVFGFIALMAGGNARIQRTFSTVSGSLYSTLEILSYDLSYASVPQTFSDWISLRYDLNDIAVTGLCAKNDDFNVLSGAEGYVLDLSNPCFDGYTEEETGNFLADQSEYFIGKTFRKFEGETFGYPLAEFMDAIEAVDSGISFFSVLTDVSFDFTGKTSFKTSAESNVAQGATYTSQAQKAIIKTKELILQERTQREAAIAQVNTMLASTRGMYSDTDENGVTFLHDKPELSDSQNIIKVTADSIAFSTSGNTPEAYTYGFTINGDAILNMLVADGILTNWLKTSVISSNDGSTVLDLENNEFSLGGGKISYTVDEGGNGVLTINADVVNFAGAQVATQQAVDDAINQTQGSIDDLNSAVSSIQQATDNLSSYISIVPADPSVTIGTDEGNVRITDQDVEISGSDGAQTIIGSSRTTMNSLTVANDARIGNFAWVTTESDGNLVLKYVGV